MIVYSAFTVSTFIQLAISLTIECDQSKDIKQNNGYDKIKIRMCK